MFPTPEWPAVDTAVNATARGASHGTHRPMPTDTPHNTPASLDDIPQRTHTSPTMASHLVCASMPSSLPQIPEVDLPLLALTCTSQGRMDTPQPRPRTGSNTSSNMLVAPGLAHSPSYSSDPLSDSEKSFTNTVSTTFSSSESSESVVIATPGRRRPSSPAMTTTEPALQLSVDTALSRPPSIICTTDDELPARTVWTPSPRKKLPFWGRPSRELRRNVSAPSTPRSRSPDSPHSQTPSSSSPGPRTSSEHSSSQPSIRVSESHHGAPRLSFVEGKNSLLGPPLGALVHLEDRATSPSGDSMCTITGTPSSSSRTAVLKSTCASPVEPSPVSRKRRLNALRTLVASMDFGGPDDHTEKWNVVNYDDSDDEFWASDEKQAPQLNRLSFGSSFKADSVSRLARESTVSLPPAAPSTPPTKGACARTRRYSRSMVSLVENHPYPHTSHSPRPRIPKRVSSRQCISPSQPSSRPQSPLTRPISPPMSLMTVPPPRFELEPILPTSLHRSGTAIRKSTSARPIGTPREFPRPRARKESFGVVYSGYTKSLRPTSPRAHQATSWRSCLASEQVYDRIAAGHDGQLEVKRQEIMWEMCETEAAFVRACRDVIRLFITPLRDAQGEWMKGLPTGACELFESLEVIYHAHSELSIGQQIAQRTSEDVLDIGTFVDHFGAWVHRLACHEKYLMLFNTVVAEIEEAARDEQSNFGEFLRLQTKDNALGSLTVGSMLLKPVQRLTKYTLFLKRLLSATPEPHPTHLKLVKVIALTEKTISKLETCKAREDDYVQLLALEERLTDIPNGFNIAVRGRRLIAHAQVIRISRDPQLGLSRSGSLRNLRVTIPSMVSAGLPLRNPAVRQNSIASVQSGSSRATRSTQSSRAGSTDIEQSPVYSLSSSPSTSSSLYSMSSPTMIRPERALSRSPSTSSSLAESVRPSSKMGGALRKVRRDDVYTMLIFNDMVALAAPAERQSFFKSRKTEFRLRLVPAAEGGMGTVDDVREMESSGYKRVFALAMRIPDGTGTVARFAVAPPSSSARRAQRNAVLPGQALETVEQVVSTLGGKARVG